MRTYTFEVRCKDVSGTDVTTLESESLERAAAYHASQLHADSKDYLSPAEYDIDVRSAPPYNGPWHRLRVEVKTTVNFHTKVLGDSRRVVPDLDPDEPYPDPLLRPEEEQENEG